MTDASVCIVVKENFVRDVNFNEHSLFCGESVMVWAGITFNRRVRLQFIKGSLNVLSLNDKILKPPSEPICIKLDLKQFPSRNFKTISRLH